MRRSKMCAPSLLRRNIYSWPLVNNNSCSINFSSVQCYLSAGVLLNAVCTASTKSRKKVKALENEEDDDDDDEKTEISFTFIDIEGDDDEDEDAEPEDGHEYDPEEKFREILHDGSEAFGYESGAAVFGTKNDKSLGSDDFIHPDLTAAEVAKKYGTVILIHPRDDVTPTGSYHTFLGDPPEEDEEDD